MFERGAIASFEGVSLPFGTLVLYIYLNLLIGFKVIYCKRA